MINNAGDGGLSVPGKAKAGGNVWEWSLAARVSTCARHSDVSVIRAGT